MENKNQEKILIISNNDHYAELNSEGNIDLSTSKPLPPITKEIVKICGREKFVFSYGDEISKYNLNINIIFSGATVCFIQADILKDKVLDMFKLIYFKNQKDKKVKKETKQKEIKKIILQNIKKINKPLNNIINNIHEKRKRYCHSSILHIDNNIITITDKDQKIMLTKKELLEDLIKITGDILSLEIILLEHNYE